MSCYLRLVIGASSRVVNVGRRPSSKRDGRLLSVLKNLPPSSRPGSPLLAATFYTIDCIFMTFM